MSSRLAPTATRALARFLTLALVLALASAASGASARAVPVVVATDIGDDIDDTWALVLALKSPELDVKLVLTDYGDTARRVPIVARLLQVAGRTEIPIGIGVRQEGGPTGQDEWVKGYDLAAYPGRVHQDGVQALVDLALASREPVTLVALGPPPSLAEALRREPRIAGKLRLAGMYGSLRTGYSGKPKPEPEWNVKASAAAARALLQAPWREAIVTPLDTCGLVTLQGERYARLRASKDPLLVALFENYELWCRTKPWCAKEPDRVATRSSTLFDTVAVYLAVARDLVVTEALGVRVTDDGMTLPDPAARQLLWATAWKDLDGYEEWLTRRLLAAPPARPR
jgi:inosine-uridine nucleoside N-ribohydrolase